jgi:hypothetical protein
MIRASIGSPISGRAPHVASTSAMCARLSRAIDTGISWQRQHRRYIAETLHHFHCGPVRLQRHVVGDVEVQPAGQPTVVQDLPRTGGPRPGEGGHLSEILRIT